MLSSVVSPGSYRSHNISGSLYLMVLGLAAGYILVLSVNELLDRYSVEPDGPVGAHQAIIWFIVRNRWFWVPAVYLVALLLVSIVTLTPGANAAQFIYSRF